MSKSVPLAFRLDSERIEFPIHRHLKYRGLFTRAQCPAYCKCGHICPWHYDGNEIVGACGWVKLDGTKCECTQFAEK